MPIWPGANYFINLGFSFLPFKAVMVICNPPESLWALNEIKSTNHLLTVRSWSSWVSGKHDKDTITVEVTLWDAEYVSGLIISGLSQQGAFTLHEEFISEPTPEIISFCCSSAKQFYSTTFICPTQRNAKTTIIVIANTYITPTYVPETVLSTLNAFNPHKNPVRQFKGN